MATALKVALVGVGQRGLHHVECLSQLQAEEEVQLTALVDPFADNLAEEKIRTRAPTYSQGGTQLFNDVDEMIDAVNPDAVWFAMPPNQHRGEIERTAARGIAVFAEKPQTLFYDEAAAMAKAIESAGVPSIVGFQMRYEPWYVALRDHLTDQQVASMLMVAVGAVEGHGVKHSHTEEQGGPASRVWTADREWSGTSIVEAGIHQTDLMRYWSHNDVEWVQANYVQRPPELHATQGDNPVAYTVVYGFANGAIGNLIFTKPGRAYFVERYDFIITAESHIKFEDDLVVYHYDGDDYPPSERPSAEQARKVIAEGPRPNAMGPQNTLKLDRSFVRSIVESRPELRKSSFAAGLNSLAAVLAANVSDELGGERVYLEEFTTSDRFARYRSRPVGA